MKNLNKNLARIATLALMTTACAAAFAQSNAEIAARDQANETARNNYPVVIFHSTQSRAQVESQVGTPDTAGAPGGYQQVAAHGDNSEDNGSTNAADASLYSGA